MKHAYSYVHNLIRLILVDNYMPSKLCARKSDDDSLPD